MTASYPTSFDEIRAWAAESNVDVQEARVRFAQYSVLRAVATSRMLSAVLVFKGGNALDFVWQPNRSTRDLDFSADTSELDPPGGAARLRELLTPPLGWVGRELALALAVQTVRQQPPGEDKTFITYRATVGYALPDDPRSRERIRLGEVVSSVIPLDVSLNEPICADTLVDFRAARPLRVSTVEDIVAEKLRALLQQPIRNRQREQDLLDIAVILKRGVRLDPDRVARFLREKAQARGVPISKAALRDPDVAARARRDYDALRSFTRTTFIPFEEALVLLHDMVRVLPIPD